MTCGWAVDFTRPLLARGLSLKSRLDYYANKLECRETRKLRRHSVDSDLHEVRWRKRLIKFKIKSSNAPYLMPNAANENVRFNARECSRKSLASGKFPIQWFLYSSVGCVHGLYNDSICPFLQHHIALLTSCGNRYVRQCGHFGTASSS